MEMHARGHILRGNDVNGVRLPELCGKILP
jgi:hypothetical protein